VEVAQRRGDYALCGAVVQVTRDGDALADARVALFGVGQRPVRARSVEERLLAGDAPSGGLVRQAALRASDGLEPQTDRQASADHRRHLARVLVRRGLEQALELAA
jgi:carbon-monoxide dehydrogenase medium subunit